MLRIHIGCLDGFYLSGLNVESEVVEEESDMLPPSVEMDGYNGDPGFPWIPGDFTTPTRRNSFHA